MTVKSLQQHEKGHIKSILLMSIPIIAENLLQALLGVTDTYFAGHIADEAIAAIGATNLLMNMLTPIFSALAIGSVAVVARWIGRQDNAHAGRSMISSIMLGIVAGLLFGVVCFVLRTPLLKIAGAKDVMDYAVPYYMIVAVPCVILSVQLILSSCLRAIRDTRSPMIVTALGNVLKVLLSMLFMEIGRAHV